jgi:hypothetical protein
VSADINAYLTANRGPQRHWMAKKLVCADGFRMSVQASEYHYCSPRDNDGPYTLVEVGYPTEAVDALMPYIDGADCEPTDTVYGYVPVEVINQIIEQHGGIAVPD